MLGFVKDAPPMAAAATPPADFDSPWKDALSFYFEGFLQLLAPWLHQQIDWRHPPVFLDKELQALRRGGGNGRRYVDKLVRVHSKSRKLLYLLIHIEIQGGVI
ncbi:hypothetical protein H0A66_14155, partial [Alcaligenaceae bacterium]|nr:hypothetical protein [Alcaligenaceae bacterium]